LLACAFRIPVAKTLGRTLATWGRQLIGFDLRPELVRIAKARLFLAAARQSVDAAKWNQHLTDLFPRLLRKSGLSVREPYREATHIVLNPPFTPSAAPRDCSWASGNVNSASLFLEACLNKARDGTQVAAILPDVLRSGSRYQRWRESISRNSVIKRIEIHGQFDRAADVDVFFLDLLVARGHGTNRITWARPSCRNSRRVGDFFRVKTGSVVEYRDLQDGASRPYVRPSDLPPWGTIRRTNRKRRYRGRLESPPFVAVRRTSRPGDRYRAIPTIVSGRRLVAVENHLIVLTPLDGTLESC